MISQDHCADFTSTAIDVRCICSVVCTVATFPKLFFLHCEAEILKITLHVEKEAERYICQMFFRRRELSCSIENCRTHGIFRCFPNPNHCAECIETACNVLGGPVVDYV